MKTFRGKKIRKNKKTKNIPYIDDAIKFTSAFQNVLVLCKAYGAEGGLFYKNQELLQDIINYFRFFYVTSVMCRKPKQIIGGHGEIGIPKELIPSLMIIFDSLTKEQIWKYTEGIAFFQLDPFHEGGIGTASTHGQGYRKGKGQILLTVLQ